jgi:hypothetical protein
MATVGNLELRIGNDTLYGSSTHDGYNVYRIINRLATFLDKIYNPSPQQYKDWFRETARKELLPFKHSEKLTKGVPCEVIIDATRRLILFNANDDEMEEFVSVSTVKRLCGKHKYQTWRYTKPKYSARS